jgi:hypothetical protein
MQIQTQFSYEKTWSDTSEKDLLLIIEKEIGDADPKGTLEYIKEVTAKDKVITVGSCKFRKKQG